MADPRGEGPPSEGGDPPLEGDAALAAVLRAAAGMGQVEEIDELPPTTDLAWRDRAQDIELKRRYAYVLLAMMGLQLLAANGVFIAYAWAGVDWQVEAGVMQVWLGATVVEIIGVVAVIVRYLFPRRDFSP